MTVTAEDIARVAHEVNRAYCAAIGDPPKPAWKDAPDYQRQSALKGVNFHAYADHTPEQSHESWLEAKREDGWVYGPDQDENARTHPCILPYADLPQPQRVKDHLFVAVVHAMRARLVDDAVPQPEPAPDRSAAAAPVPPPTTYMQSLDGKGDNDIWDFSDAEIDEVLHRLEVGALDAATVGDYLDTLLDSFVQREQELKAEHREHLEQVRANLLDTFASMAQVPIGFNGLIDEATAKTLMERAIPEGGVEKLAWFAEAEGRLRYLKADAMVLARAL
jgi:hypothetical protein